MKRLKMLILLFCMALSLPMTYVVWRTYQGVAAEEQAQLRYFAEAMFDDMETEMAALVQQEENRAVDEYRFTLARGGEAGAVVRSPLSEPPRQAYILGYLQNNPDGSFETPLMPDNNEIPAAYRPLVKQLKAVNTLFNEKKFAMAEHPSPPAVPKPAMAQPREQNDMFSNRFFTARGQKTARDSLGQQKSRIEEITPQQAMNVTQKEKPLPETGTPTKSESDTAVDREIYASKKTGEARRQAGPSSSLWSRGMPEKAAESEATPALAPTDRFRAEVAPLQSVFIDADQMFIFRRVGIGNRIYRQGFVLRIGAFLQHLEQRYYDRQPMAAFTGLHLNIRDHGGGRQIIKAGVADGDMKTVAMRTFPAPFDWFTAVVKGSAVPASPVRKNLDLALAGLGGIMLLGLFVIYRSARAVMVYAERRQQFVSSVTHELKTPLTNIRMYVEMLEQGIAATPEREQDYLAILNSESARLSGLINNVLELSKLEKRQRHFHYQDGRLADVFEAVPQVMESPLARAGFVLSVEAGDVPVLSYDRDVLVQVICNLVENSIKFGRQSDPRRITIRAASTGGWVNISVSDTGPGIPKKALGRVFDDFYRVDNDLTRSTGGTGIGLALVKKFVTAMGGRVNAANNDGPGCTITISLPASRLKAPDK